MYTSESIFEQFKGIFAENLELSVEIKIENSLSDYIKDSINFIKIIVAIETLFDIEFTDDDLETDNFTDVKSLVDHVLSKL